MTPEVLNQLWSVVAPWVTGAGAVAAGTLAGVIVWIFKVARKSASIEIQFDQLVKDMVNMKHIMQGEDGTNGLNGRVKTIETDMVRGSIRMDDLAAAIKEIDRKMEGFGKSMDKGFISLTKDVAEIKGRLQDN